MGVQELEIIQMDAKKVKLTGCPDYIKTGYISINTKNQLSC